MAATKEEISAWFDRGVKSADNPTHMIVVCDTYDHDDYPVYVKPSENISEIFKKYDGKNMQKVMEVYKLSDDKEKQLNVSRCFNF